MIGLNFRQSKFCLHIPKEHLIPLLVGVFIQAEGQKKQWLDKWHIYCLFRCQQSRCLKPFKFF